MPIKGKSPCRFFQNLELGSNRCILNVAIAAGLVKLVAGKAGTCRGAIWLNRIALIQQSLLVELLQQPPKGLDVFVVISNVGVLHVDPIPHAMA